MKKLIILLALSFGAIFHLVAQNQIAIYVVGDTPDSYKKVVASALTQAVNSDGHFQAVERTGDFLSAIGSEVSYQNSGAVSQNRIVELGRQFGAQYVFVVDLNNVLGELYASSRVINVSANVVEAASDESSKVSSMEQLRTLSQKISSSTLAKLPYNVALKNQRQQERELANLKGFVSRYKMTTAQTAYSLYKVWDRNNYIANRQTVLELIEARKKLNLPIQYPVVYSIRMNSQKTYSPGKGKMNYTEYRLEIKSINSAGNTINEIKSVFIKQNGASEGQSFGGCVFEAN